MVDVAQMNRIRSIGSITCRIFGPPAHGLEQLKVFEKEINDLGSRTPDESRSPMAVFVFREKLNEKQGQDAFTEPSKSSPADIISWEKERTRRKLIMNGTKFIRTRRSSSSRSISRKSRGDFMVPFLRGVR
jgi:hypothetical protein